MVRLITGEMISEGEAQEGGEAERREKGLRKGGDRWGLYKREETLRVVEDSGRGGVA